MVIEVEISPHRLRKLVRGWRLPPGSLLKIAFQLEMWGFINERTKGNFKASYHWPDYTPGATILASPKQRAWVWARGILKDAVRRIPYVDENLNRPSLRRYRRD